MACCAQQLGVGFSVLIAESMAILRGLQFALSSGLLPALIESDCLLAVSAINSDHVYFFEVGLIIHDIVDLLRCNPGSVVSFIPRSANMAAHHLARFALRLDSDCFWMEDFPSIIQDVLFSDNQVLG
ncbi:hypothetical protein ACOSQ2_004588 [Xanthoceras sorbifolium]